MVFPKSTIPWMSLIFLPGPAKRITPSALLKALVASHKFASESMALLKLLTFPSPPTPVVGRE